MSEEKLAKKKSIFKKWWLWLIIIIVVGVVIASSSNKEQANETTKTTENSTTEPADNAKSAEQEKAALTLDDGWAIDQSNQYATYVNGYVSNNTDKTYNSYIQITFNAYDEAGANVGTCLANTNTIDSNGKWKFQAICSGDGIKTVKFKELTGF